jgi:hypothetical protein
METVVRRFLVHVLAFTGSFAALSVGYLIVPLTDIVTDWRRLPLARRRMAIRTVVDASGCGSFIKSLRWARRRP